MIAVVCQAFLVSPAEAGSAHAALPLPAGAVGLCQGSDYKVTIGGICSTYLCVQCHLPLCQILTKPRARLAGTVAKSLGAAVGNTQ